MKNNIGKKIFMIPFMGIFFLIGCKPNIGTPVIEKNKMAEIITEIYLTKITLETTPIPPRAQNNYFYCNILEKHGITEEKFDSAVTWYASHMDIFEQVYKQVASNLTARRTALDIPQPEQE
jgi:hypothetical protein